MQLAERLLGPLAKGLEIGASAIAPFPGVSRWNLDYPWDDAVFQAAQRDAGWTPVPVDVHGSAEALPLRDGCVDFVLASHVIEHMPDTIRALAEWDRVVRPGGLLFLIVPHKERTFDKHRPRTPLAHHLADYARGNTVANDPQAPTSHYHVWITADFVTLVEHLIELSYLDWELVEIEDVDSRAGNGFTLVARKRGTARRGDSTDRDTATPVAFHELTLRLPFQAPGADLATVYEGPDLPAELDLPRGLYEVLPVHAGFPPQAGQTRLLALGESLPAPQLSALVQSGQTLRVQGLYFCETTFLEARLPDGSTFHIRAQRVDDELHVDLAGLVLPPGPLPLVAVNLAPGGGRSNALPFTPGT